MEGKDMTVLSHFIRFRSVQLKPKCMVKVIQDVIIGLQSLHSKLVTHRNIDSESVFIITDTKVNIYTIEEINYINYLQIKISSSYIICDTI